MKKISLALGLIGVAAVIWMYAIGLPGQRALEFRIAQNGKAIATAIVGMPDSRPLEKCWDSFTDRVIFSVPEAADGQGKIDLSGGISVEVAWKSQEVDSVVVERLTLVKSTKGWRLEEEQIRQIRTRAREGESSNPEL